LRIKQAVLVQQRHSIDRSMPTPKHAMDIACYAELPFLI
jgi:hypothetical protein